MDNGGIYCRWGEKEGQWFKVFDPAIDRNRWFP